MRLPRHLVRRLDRYVLIEILGPLGLGFLVYTFILLLRALFSSAEMIIERGVPALTVAKLLALGLPNIVVLTIPMSLLFGILIAVGRLSADSELVAMRSCGVGLLSLYRPILLVSGALTAVTLYLMLTVLPLGNAAVQRLTFEISSANVAQLVEPGVFNEQFEGKVLYIFDIPFRSKVWKGVFLADSLPGSKNEVTVAGSGEVRVAKNGQHVEIHLQDAVTHRVDFDHPDRYEQTRHLVLDRVLDDPRDPRVRSQITKGLRSLPIPELHARAVAPESDPTLRNQAWIEIHKRFAISFACIVFGLCALPLGINSKRGGRSSGFALSIGVILVYYLLLNNGEEAARAGQMSPAFAMWRPNLLLAIAGSILLWRRHRERPPLVSGLDLRLGSLLRVTLERRRTRRREARRARVSAGAAAAAALRRQDAHVVLRLPRLRWRFPKILDRYVLKTFGWIAVLVTLSVLSIYIVSDLSDNIDDMLKNHVRTSVVVDYYKYLSLQIVYDMAPVVVLVTTLITYSLLSRRNEVTACRALGISLYRLSVPAVVAAAAIAAGSVYLQSEVLPASNEQVSRLKDVIKNREKPRTYRRADRQWLFGRDRFMYNYLRYDPRDRSFERLQAFEFDDRHRLVKRLFASRGRFVDGRWIFVDGWARTFVDTGAAKFQRFLGPTIIDFPEKPEYFETDVQRPEQMSYGELRDYVRVVERQTGRRPPDLEVQLQSKIAFPVISLVMALVALPFGFRLGRRGALYGIGVSIIMGMVFLAVYAFFTTMGTAGLLPPIVAVWSPNVLFALLSFYLFLGMPT